MTHDVTPTREVVRDLLNFIDAHAGWKGEDPVPIELRIRAEREVGLLIAEENADAAADTDPLPLTRVFGREIRE